MRFSVSRHGVGFDECAESEVHLIIRGGSHLMELMGRIPSNHFWRSKNWRHFSWFLNVNGTSTLYEEFFEAVYATRG